MKKYLFSISILLLFFSCDKKTTVEKAVEKIPVKIQIDRFDQVFFESKPQDLARIKKQYPHFFPSDTPDSVWIQKIQNPLWRELYAEVQKKYKDFDPVQSELTTLFQHIKYYFPKTKTPKITTVIAEMDYNNKIIYTDSLVVISLELYLGKDHRFYEFPNYIKQRFEPRQILPDLISSFAATKIRMEKNPTFLDQMINEGKILYLKEVLLSDYSEDEIMGYTTSEISWCQENEMYIWRYFLENNLLYSSDPKLNSRFISPAPFSKFYLEIDNESPGQVGAWMGWQIVRSYAEHTTMPIEDILKMSAKELFEKSKYKPKK